MFQTVGCAGVWIVYLSRSERATRVCCIAAAFGVLWWNSSYTNAQGPASATRGPTSFIRDVAPILKESCFACHDAKKRKGKVDMTTYEGLRKGGDKDDPVVPGKPEESLLIDLLTAKDNSRMPPPKDGGEALPREKIAVLEQWIK